MCGCLQNTSFAHCSAPLLSAFQLSCATAELFTHATGGNPAVNRATKESHLFADGGSPAAANSAKSQGDHSSTTRLWLFNQQIGFSLRVQTVATRIGSSFLGQALLATVAKMHRAALTPSYALHRTDTCTKGTRLASMLSSHEHCCCVQHELCFILLTHRQGSLSHTCKHPFEQQSQGTALPAMSTHVCNAMVPAGIWAHLRRGSTGGAISLSCTLSAAPLRQHCQVLLPVLRLCCGHHHPVWGPAFSCP